MMINDMQLRYQKVMDIVEPHNMILMLTNQTQESGFM